MGEHRGRLRSALHRLSSSDETLEAEDLRETADKFGGTPVQELPDRQAACVCGTLKSVTLRPRAGVPALVAELYDGSGTLFVVWLGRRQIPGIDPGRTIRVRGRVAQREGRPVMFNPRYDLLPGGPE
ncbi:OB-fold nucleic acid binding domain-containing protein [Angustibacter peucedani]